MAARGTDPIATVLERELDAVRSKNAQGIGADQTGGREHPRVRRDEAKGAECPLARAPARTGAGEGRAGTAVRARVEAADDGRPPRGAERRRLTERFVV